MPTIEVVSIDQAEPLVHADFSFAVEAEPSLRSHRALWQSKLDSLSGWIYHLGNPAMRGIQGGPFFGSELLSDAFLEEGGTAYLEFAPAHVEDVRTLIAEAMTASPSGRALFFTDWQFGPEPYEYPGELPPDDFWSLHRAKGLRMNALYQLR